MGGVEVLVEGVESSLGSALRRVAVWSEEGGVGDGGWIMRWELERLGRRHLWTRSGGSLLEQHGCQRFVKRSASLAPFGLPMMCYVWQI